MELSLHRLAPNKPAFCILSTRSVAHTEGFDEKVSMTHKTTLLVSIVMVFLLSACGGGSQDAAKAPGEEAKTDFDVTSSAFEEGGAIPARHTCDGQDVSPPLSWGSTPDGTESLALIADDPDAPGGMFVHWVIYNLPPDTRRLPEDVPNRDMLPNGAAQGVNGAGSVGYVGPCPPSGTHRYFFRVYALDTELDLGGGATKEALLDAMEGHVLAEGHLLGTYRRG
jgi:Raf kinase inhibitor-like YbhB/YbcL family protein